MESLNNITPTDRAYFWDRKVIIAFFAYTSMTTWNEYRINSSFHANSA